MHPSLSHIDHRPWPLPSRPWIMSMQWEQLLFAHWPVSIADLRPHIPAGLEIESFDGSAWIGVVPFAMTKVHPRGIPPLSFYSNFLELNVRTYVQRDGKPGVWFFSLDAASKLAVRAARVGFHLPYFDASMSLTTQESTVSYSSVRTHNGAVGANFKARYRPISDQLTVQAGSFEHWATERYCLYAARPNGDILRGEIHHQQWPLQHAEAEFEQLDLTRIVNIELPPVAPRLHYAQFLAVAAWMTEQC